VGSNIILLFNPDIYFGGDVVRIPMVEYMSNDGTIGMMMPQILNTDEYSEFYLNFTSPLSIL
jgi:GT2 family glycosyltransferase